MNVLNIKKFLIIMWLLWLIALPYAWSQSAIYYFELGTITIKTVYNIKNEVVARLEYTPLDVTYGYDISTARGKTVKIKNDKETETITGKFVNDGIRLLISMGKTLEGKDAWLDYTTVITPGQKIISNLEFETEAKFIGQTLKVWCTISNRKVLSIDEKVISSLETWNCVKTGYNMNLKNKTLGIAIPVEVYVEEWFADGVGIVQTDVYRNGKLYERRLLTGFRK